MKYQEKTNFDFIPWQPSSWPNFNVADNNLFEVINLIFNQTIIEEIDNVIKDAINNNGSIEHRGHVIAIAQLCAVDTFSSYAFYDEESVACETCNRKDSKINKYKKFIESFFPKEYQKFADDLYKLYRNTMVHSWNLFEVGILPNNTPPIRNNGCLIFGLLNFQNALNISVRNFLKQLKTNPSLQKNTLDRYKKLQKTAKS